MSIEDIHYLKNNSIKQTCIILIDSKNRNFDIYPDPSEYVVNFDVPFKNVIGFDIIDSSIPRTMYSIDKYNNSIFIYIHPDNNETSFNNIIKNLNNNNNTDPTFKGIFIELKLTIGDYTFEFFIDEFNTIIKENFIKKYFPDRNDISLEAK